MRIVYVPLCAVFRIQFDKFDPNFGCECQPWQIVAVDDSAMLVSVVSHIVSHVREKYLRKSLDVGWREDS